jgi:Mrp family chromosome partitioning ATPase
VILVVNPGQTKKDALRATMTQLERAEARILGVVINRIGKSASYHYEYYYPRQYYQTDQNV